MTNQPIKKENKNIVEEEKFITQPQVEIIGGIACPIDPQERLQCEACQ